MKIQKLNKKINQISKTNQDERHTIHILKLNLYTVLDCFWSLRIDEQELACLKPKAKNSSHKMTRLMHTTNQ